jgi:hypothetical protein
MMVNGKYEYHRMGIGTSAGMQAAEHLHALLVSFPPTRLVLRLLFAPTNSLFLLLLKISAESYLHGILSQT